MKAAADLKEQFLSLVSHELRTPVTVVISNATVLLRRGQSLSGEDYQQSLQDIANEGRRLETVIENLLFLTRLESDRELELEPVSLRRMVSECIDSFAHGSSARIVETVEEGPLDVVSGQPELLAMVLDNLLSNAAKYSDPGTPILVRSRMNEGGEAEITVRDQGIGIEESDLPQLFTPYYRSEAAIRHAKGMGVGLAVCKRIIEAHGGRIWASPRPEGGTDFTFCLPSGAHHGGK
jgi:signal transduction histidine kinase